MRPSTTCTAHLFRHLGSPTFNELKGRASIGDLYPTEKRRGNYFQTIANGEFSLGESTSSVRRFPGRSRTCQSIAAIVGNLLDQELHMMLGMLVSSAHAPVGSVG